MTMQRVFFLLLSVTPLLLAAAIWNLSVEPPDQTDMSDSTSYDSLPDTLATNLELKRFGADGKLVQQISSQSAESFEEGERIIMQQPELLIFGSDQGSWFAVGSQGLVDWPGGQLILSGAVQLRRLDAEQLELYTEQLSWHPFQAVAFSDQDVLILSPGNEIRAGGISIDLDRTSFSLFSSVRGIHAAP